MSEFRISSTPERNPETHQKHRQEAFWQITFPMLAGAVILMAVVGVMVWAGLSGRGDLSQWADVSLIWLILPILVASLLLLAILVALVYAVIMLIRVIPPYSYQAQMLLDVLASRVKQSADTAVEPILRIQSITAGIQALLSSLSPRKRSRRKESGNY